VASSRTSGAGASLGLALFLCGSAFVFAPLASSTAAEAQTAKKTRVAAAEVTKTAVAEAPAEAAPSGPTEDDLACFRPRKRLWVEGEGWIIRRVTVCR
jgi:hypothetical protein